MARTRPWAPLEQEVLEVDSPAARFLGYLRRSFAPAERTGERDVASLVTSNLLMDREAALEVGGFDPRFRYGGEEEELFRRLSRAGRRLVFVPDAVVQHEFDPRLPDTLRRSRAYGRGNARMFLKHIDMTPTIYPFPFVAAAAVAAGLARPRLLPVAVLLPFALYPRWAVELVRERDPRLGLHAYIQLLQEGACNVGWVDVARFERDRFDVEIQARRARLRPGRRAG